MNPAELRMMWMSQYNPERISLEDAASLFGHHPSVGLSVMDDLTQQTTLDLNPMMSIVGGDFTSQAAAAAAALGVQPGTLITTTNATTNNIYGFAQMGGGGGLHQQLLQQSTAAAAVFQNFNDAIHDEDDDDVNVTGVTGVDDMGTTTDDQQVYGHLDDDGGYDDGTGGCMSDLEPKQEIINIDDFVMMNDSNSYDDADFMNSSDKDISQSSSSGMTNIAGIGGVVTDVEHDLLVPLSDGMMHHKLLGTTLPMVASMPTTSAAVAVSGGGNVNMPSTAAGAVVTRTARKTRKIEPVNRPGLVLKTPIAYKGNIDPSVIPIQKDGMAVCERCGAIGVKHTFYTKSRRFCSMACARGELYSMVVNNNSKMTDQQQHQQHQQQQQQQQQQSVASFDAVNDENIENMGMSSNDDLDGQQDSTSQSDIELALRVAHIKNANYRFRITDQSKITQLNGFGEPMTIGGGDVSDLMPADTDNVPSLNGSDDATIGDTDSNATTTNADGSTTTTSTYLPVTQAPKALRMFRDIFPQDELPQIPKFERLPVPCPQMEKIISVRRRHYDPTHSFDWTTRLSKANFFAAPVTCFPHAPGYEVWDNLGIQMKVEVENTDCDNIEVIQPGQTPTSFWVATILEICGYKALMRYEGFDASTHDFWVNLCNAEVHSVGWCATRGKPLIPPRTIEHKYKDWKDFLVERLSGARTLPSSFYNKINDSMQSRFRLGLNLECVDKDRISQVRLATVTKIVGKRLFLRYFDSDDGFWCHEDSPIIHPVGWATTVGHNLAAPQDYLERMLAGREAMIEVHEDDATIELFKMNFTFDEYFLDGKTNGFIEGMKIEAVDPLNLSSICPATVMAVLKFGYMMIRIDSYQPDASGSDWFCYHEKSPSIFPAGFCASNNITITPPNGYTAQTFSWERYVRDTGSVAAGQHLFHRIVPNHGFEVGMSLECADLMDPRLVCVATVARVVGRLLKIHFDGWTDEYDQWLDCESADIYPIGWCVLVNHKLEGPPRSAQQHASKAPPKPKVQKKRKKKVANVSATATVKQQQQLQQQQPQQQQHEQEQHDTVKPRTIALKTTPHLPKLSIKLELKPEHYNAALYENIQNEEEDDDDDDGCDGESTSLHSNQSTTQASTLGVGSDISTVSGSFSGEFSAANSTPTDADTEMPTACKTTPGVAAASAAAAAAAVPANNNKATATTTATTVKTTKTTKSPAPPTVGRKATKYIGNSSVSSSKYIPRLSEINAMNDVQEATPMELMPETWNVYDVSQFLRVNDCTAHCDTFSRNKIDGKRLLQLTKDDIIPLLGMKVGPALKISDLIQQLKCKLNPSKSRMHKGNKSSFL